MGRCMFSHTLGSDETASISLSSKSAGCDVTNLILSIPSISFIIFNRSASLELPPGSLPYESTFCPNNVTSLKPFAASPLTSLHMSSGCLLLSRPRVNGTTQNVQNLSQPSTIPTHAFTGCDLLKENTDESAALFRYLFFLRTVDTLSPDFLPLFSSNPGISAILSVPKTKSTYGAFFTILVPSC